MDKKQIKFNIWIFIDLVLTDIRKLIWAYFGLCGTVVISCSNGSLDKFIRTNYSIQNNGIVVTIVFLVLIFLGTMNLIDATLMNFIQKKEIFILSILEFIFLFAFPTKVIDSIFTNTFALIIVWFISIVLQKLFISKKLKLGKAKLVKSEYKKEADSDNGEEKTI